MFLLQFHLERLPAGCIVGWAAGDVRVLRNLLPVGHEIRLSHAWVKFVLIFEHWDQVVLRLRFALRLPEHALVLRVARRRSQFSSCVCIFWIVAKLILWARSILMQNVFIAHRLLLSHGYSCLCFDLRVNTFDSSTLRSPSRWYVLLSVKTSTTLFWLQFPVFIYAPGANSRLHRLLPWKSLSFKITTFCCLLFFLDYTCLKCRYFHSIFQVVLSIRFHLRTQRLQVFMFILMLILLLRLMRLNWILQRFAICCSSSFIFALIFVAL